MTFATLLERPYRHFTDFQGRSNRAEFWLFTAVAMGLFYTLIALKLGGLAGLVGLIIIVPNIALTVRRLHDANLSGWWCLLCLLPCHIGLVIQGVIGLLPGTKGPNKYGKLPKET